ncbi:hypothetical protein [Vibrio sp. WXL103]|uniref:hypothetical protein n=1 Tax=Vibrio sp. WXL103 TaxID=3450710 RepID=UPI003EC6ED07
MNDQQRLAAAEQFDSDLYKTLDKVVEAEKLLQSAWQGLVEHYVGLGAEETEQAYRQLSGSIERYKVSFENILAISAAQQQSLRSSTEQHEFGGESLYSEEVIDAT